MPASPARRRPTSEAYDRLFARLDWLTERLRDQRYLVGDTITEADVRLFTTLARFDPVYHGHFKCNRQKLSELPVLWAYARDLFQTPGFGDTIDFVQIKQHYYLVHTDINPTRIVPNGPDLSGWLTPHGREATRRPPLRRRHPARPRPRRRRSPRRPRRRLSSPTARASVGRASSVTRDRAARFPIVEWGTCGRSRETSHADRRIPVARETRASGRNKSETWRVRLRPTDEAGGLSGESGALGDREAVDGRGRHGGPGPTVARA